MMTDSAKADDDKRADEANPPATSSPKQDKSDHEKMVERGGPKGPEPTRFGDWESGGRCTDF